jgi:alkanesulfonate monooxygenase SsuD/methylene tetrahydromethanopterin reductase-like flavin-dependent oxidoreductase (luciferase family)
MRFGAAFWVNRCTWADLRDAALAAERAGWESLWIDDHLLADEGDPDDPKFEGWTTLAALAVLTTRVRLGLLVAANTFRPPGLTAKLATTLDHLSNGRAVLGLGGGWFEQEHEAFGIDFGAGFGERLDRLDEAVGLIRRLLDGERIAEHRGRFYELHDALVEPRPTARDADLWNGYGPPETIAANSAILAERCAEIGRPFEAIERTVTAHLVLRDTDAAARRAWTETADRHGLTGRIASDGTEHGLTVGGSPAEVAAYLRGYRDIGISEVIVVFRDPFDLETISSLGALRESLAALA